MPEKPPADSVNRRGFLTAAGLAGAGLAMPRHASATEAATPDPLITEVQDWQRHLGDGVDKRPYGSPSQFEKNVIRRNVPWLTASAESSVNFTPLHELDGIITPSGLCFERHHGGVAEIDPGETPPDDQRSGGKTAGVHHGRHQADAPHQPDQFPRMLRQFGNGMARCPVERLPVHARNDSQRDVHRRSAEGAAGRGRPAPQRQMADARRRRRIGHEPLAADRKGSWRCVARLCHERGGASARAGLSAAGGDPGLGRQSLDQMAAPHRGWRPAVADPRRDREIYRPSGRRPRPQAYLHHGCEVGGDKSVAAGASQIQGAQRAERFRLVGPRRHQAGGCIARRRTQLADGADRRSGARQVADAILRRLRLERSRRCWSSRGRWTRRAMSSRARRS